MPTYNRRDVVLKSVEAMRALRADHVSELIVVVDGSTDGTAEALRALEPLPFPLIVIEQVNRGAAAARNAGAAVATGSRLLFLDDDMIADPDLVEAHANTDADAVVGSIPLHPDSPSNVVSDGVAKWAERRHERLVANGGQVGLPDMLSGQMSVRADLFHQLGGFDEMLTADGTFGGEDTDLHHRLLRSGAKIAFAADAISHQQYVVTPDHALRQWREAGRSDSELARKHPELRAELREYHDPASIRKRVAHAALDRMPSPLRAVVRQRILRRAEDGRLDKLTAGGFALLREHEYRTGVRENGGFDGPGSPRILAYHAVDEHPTGALAPYSVTPAQLDDQLAALRNNGYELISADQLLGYIDGTWAAPERAVHLTFDDGYTSNLSHALPSLSRANATATVFAVTSEMGGTNRWDSGSGIHLELMDADQFGKLRDEGWEIGAHSRTHAHLRQLDADALTAEVAGSISDLELMGFSARIFSYPYGEHDRRVRQTVANAGARAAVGLVESVSDVSPVHRFNLPRIELGGDISPRDLLGLLAQPQRQRRRTRMLREATGAARRVKDLVRR